MARAYPRFLFSNPKDTKSPGPFVIHLLEPRFIARVEVIERPHLYNLHLLECFDREVLETDPEFEAATIWFYAQIKKGTIKF